MEPKDQVWAFPTSYFSGRRLRSAPSIFLLQKNVEQNLEARPRSTSGCWSCRRAWLGRIPHARCLHVRRHEPCNIRYNNDALLRFHESVKDAIDRQRNSCSGKSGIWPKRLRPDLTFDRRQVSEFTLNQQLKSSIEPGQLLINAVRRVP